MNGIASATTNKNVTENQTFGSLEADMQKKADLSRMDQEINSIIAVNYREIATNYWRENKWLILVCLPLVIFALGAGFIASGFSLMSVFNPLNFISVTCFAFAAFAGSMVVSGNISNTKAKKLYDAAAKFVKQRDANENPGLELDPKDLKDAILTCLYDRPGMSQKLFDAVAVVVNENLSIAALNAAASRKILGAELLRLAREEDPNAFPTVSMDNIPHREIMLQMAKDYEIVNSDASKLVFNKMTMYPARRAELIR